MVTHDEGPRLTSQAERDESPSERADRNFLELVQEVRVAQIGVQILFGFLLTLSFYDSFPIEAPHAQVLTAALLTTLLSALFFVAPVVAHRLSFRMGEKERLVWLTHRFTEAGLAALAIAMDLSVWLVLARLWSVTLATWVSLLLVVLILVVWVALPLWALRGTPPAPDEPPHAGPVPPSAGR